MHRSKSGFTLVELLVVIGIIAVLMAILMPALAKARVKALEVQCLTRHRNLMNAMFMYVDANNGWAMPAALLNIDGTNYWMCWTSNRYLGQYVNNRNNNKDGPASTTEINCPLFQGTSCGNNGIGIDIRNGNNWFRGGLKFTSRQRPADKIIVFVDVYDGFQWEKYYYDEPGPYNATGGTTNGMVAYRHGNVDTVASFADGHAEVFTGKVQKSTNPTVIPTYQNSGLHAAALDGSITHKPNLP
jgi:prepilin-type N-terminal cleavage/methylation domain-containing protein